ncbi:MAG: YceI family protein [Pseudomonadota bacterium]
MTRIALAAAAFILAAVLPAAAQEPPAWTVDYDQSRLGFTGAQNGAAFDGVFEKFTADIAFDPAAPETARIEVVVDMASAVTGKKDRDRALPGKDWFDVKDHPQATFLAEGARATDDGGYEADGTLSIRGVSKPVTLAFSLAVEGDAATAEGGASLVRSDFGVGRGEFATGKWVALEVGVTFTIVAARR